MSGGVARLVFLCIGGIAIGGATHLTNYGVLLSCRLGTRHGWHNGELDILITLALQTQAAFMAT